MKEAWYVRRWGEPFLGPFPSREHAETVADWKNAEDGRNVPVWQVRGWSDFYPDTQTRMRNAGLAPE